LSIKRTNLTLNDITVLGLLLERETGVTGLELEKTIDTRHMRIWTKIGKSSVYFSLKNLENKGFVTSETNYYHKDQSNPPVKEKYYRITKEGRKEQEKAIFTILSTHEKKIDPFDIALAFSLSLSPTRRKLAIEARLKMIEDRKGNLESKLSEFNQQDSFGHHIDGSKNFDPAVIRNVLILFSRPLSLVKAEEEWIEKNRDDIIQ
jgi:DNA-binding PadR family transcriptional regulator